MSQHIRLIHRPSKTLLAEGPLGWAITAFEGNYYISNKSLKTNGFRSTPLPGLCIYKFIYLWLDLAIEGQPVSPRLGWRYVIPNPLFPFIWFRVAVPGQHPEIQVQIADQPFDLADETNKASMSSGGTGGEPR